MIYRSDLLVQGYGLIVLQYIFLNQNQFFSLNFLLYFLKKLFKISFLFLGIECFCPRLVSLLLRAKRLSHDTVFKGLYLRK
ncbi:MAG: DUF1418 family protein [Enterococcus lacertideformus]|uniref:DUF1418 family protein n=1 Tax=Enterococcus lacertideformus TaxID=2771493 RepID=A0A931FCS7_9ENTE|nr:DUF1418 family protein [Enterococcus lacertideformus]